MGAKPEAFPFGMPAITFPEHGVWHFLTLTQPWATLMAIGAKSIETRSWRTKWRGWFAIHASKSFPGECRDLCYTEPFNSAFLRAGLNVLATDTDLPLGKVLAVVELVDCVKTESVRSKLDHAERTFGDYSDGRYAWMTRNVRRLREPFEMRGAQGLRLLPRAIRLEDLE